MLHKTLIIMYDIYRWFWVFYFTRWSQLFLFFNSAPSPLITFLIKLSLKNMRSEYSRCISEVLKNEFVKYVSLYIYSQDIYVFLFIHISIRFYWIGNNYSVVKITLACLTCISLNIYLGMFLSRFLLTSPNHKYGILFDSIFFKLNYLY